jgi:hypothetical protein
MEDQRRMWQQMSHVMAALLKTVMLKIARAKET